MGIAGFRTPMYCLFRSCGLLLRMVLPEAILAQVLDGAQQLLTDLVSGLQGAPRPAPNSEKLSPTRPSQTPSGFFCLPEPIQLEIFKLLPLCDRLLVPTSAHFDVLK